ncbi:MAG: hypothetical protein AAFY48_22005, partial [Bacteroidota bacterium]
MRNREEDQLLNLSIIAYLCFGSILLLLVLSSCGAPEGSSAYLKDVNVTSILPEYLWEEFEEIKEEQDQI